MDFVRLLAETLFVGAQAVWLGIGAFENIRMPKANGQMVADVLSLKQLKLEAPELYPMLTSHRIESAGLQRLIFVLIVVAESIASILLAIGTVGLAGAMFGFWDAEIPRVVAALGVIGFTAVWASFLAVGQWFHYWAAYQNAQHTHLLLAIWGTATLCLLLRV